MPPLRRIRGINRLEELATTSQASSSIIAQANRGNLDDTVPSSIRGFLPSAVSSQNPVPPSSADDSSGSNKSGQQPPPPKRLHRDDTEGAAAAAAAPAQGNSLSDRRRTDEPIRDALQACADNIAAEAATTMATGTNRQPSTSYTAGESVYVDAATSPMPLESQSATASVHNWLETMTEPTFLVNNSSVTPLQPPDDLTQDEMAAVARAVADMQRRVREAVPDRPTTIFSVVGSEMDEELSSRAQMLNDFAQSAFRQQLEFPLEQNSPEQQHSQSDSLPTPPSRQSSSAAAAAQPESETGSHVQAQPPMQPTNTAAEDEQSHSARSIYLGSEPAWPTDPVLHDMAQKWKKSKTKSLFLRPQ